MIQVQAQVHGQNRALDPDQNQNRQMAKRKNVRTHHHLIHQHQKERDANIAVDQRVRSTVLGRENPRKDHGMCQKIGPSCKREQRKDLRQIVLTRKLLPKDGQDRFQGIDMKTAGMVAEGLMHHHLQENLQCVIGTTEKAGDLTQGIEKKQVHGDIGVIVPGQILEEYRIICQGVEAEDLRGGIDMIIPGQFLEGDQVQGQYLRRIVYL